MSELFLTVLNMSLTASYVILFVILIRLLLKKSPKFISYALWSVVAFRLIIPFSFESMFSLIPRSTNVAPIPHDIIYQQSPQINSGIELVDSFVSQSLPAPAIGDSANPLQIYTEIGAYIWILGIIALLTYSFVSIFILKRQLKSAPLIEDNIFEAKNLKTPFVLGLIKPKIYLPVGLNATERSYILLHEQTHIHRKDHIIKILAFLVLSIHWFNPLVWIAFILMSTDMELSCDERVLKEMNEEIKKPYASSLLSIATGKHILNGSPLAFGEGDVKGRIKNVLYYKKPVFWLTLTAVIITAIVAIGLMANPKTVTIESVAKNFSIENLERVTFGTLTLGNRVMDFSTEKAIEISDFIKELRVNKKEVSLVRGGGRDSTNQIHLATKGFGNDEMIYDIYFNFNTDFTEVWVDNGVKPSLSYKVKRPDEAKAFFERQFRSVTMPVEIVSAEELWKARTKYIGDNSAVDNLIGLLPLPEGLQFDHFKLHTNVRPYVVEIVYSTSTETLKHYDKEEKYITNFFGNNALLLLALIDNADQISSSITDGKLRKGFINVREWADDTVGRDVRNYAESQEKLQELIDSYFMSIGSNDTEQSNIVPTTQELSLEQIVGVDMVQLDYASDDIVIFHDYFGMFAYDLNSLQIVRSLDLKPLNCHQTQGDNYCDVSVSLDGNTVQLHPMSSNNMYVYTVSDNTLKETTYKPMEHSFRSRFVPIEKVINSTKLGNHSHHAVLFNTGEYGYLHSEDGTIGTLSYVRGDMKYILFEKEKIVS